MVFKLIDSYKAYNLLQIGEKFCALPQALGAVSPDDHETFHGQYGIWSERSEALRGLVDEHGAWEDFDPLYTPTPLDEEGPPEVVEIELIQTCNLRCVMCHVSYETMTKQRLDASFVNRLGGLKGKWAKVGALYEPTAHPRFAEIVQGLTRQGMKIDLTTNGTLFTPKLIDRIKDANFRMVTISFDGARPETYEKIRRRAYFERAVERTLAFREAVLKHNPKATFAVNFTVLRSNIPEIVEAVDMWENYGFDHIGFISMILPVTWGDIVEESPQNHQDELRQQMSAAVERVVTRNYHISMSSPWFRDAEIQSRFPANTGLHNAGLAASSRSDIRWPVTPGTHFQNGPFPGIPVECRSPYKFMRINFDGDVRLCQKFSVGSIYDTDLLALWDSDAAKSLRDEVKREQEICLSCEYYRFCINQNKMDYNDQSSHLSSEHIDVVGEYTHFNILRYRDVYYACRHGPNPQPADLLSPKRRTALTIRPASSLEEALEHGAFLSMLADIELVQQHSRFNVVRLGPAFFMCPHGFEVRATDLLDTGHCEALGIRRAATAQEAERLGEMQFAAA